MAGGVPVVAVVPSPPFEGAETVEDGAKAWAGFLMSVLAASALLLPWLSPLLGLVCGKLFRNVSRTSAKSTPLGADDDGEERGGRVPTGAAFHRPFREGNKGRAHVRTSSDMDTGRPPILPRSPPPSADLPAPSSDDAGKWRCACAGGSFLPPGLLAQSLGGAQAVLRMGSGQCYHTAAR